MAKKILNKIKILYIRFNKSLPMVWINRWERARMHQWQLFSNMPTESKSIEWLERNSNRLCRLSERKFNYVITRKI